MHLSLDESAFLEYPNQSVPEASERPVVEHEVPLSRPGVGRPLAVSEPQSALRKLMRERGISIKSLAITLGKSNPNVSAKANSKIAFRGCEVELICKTFEITRSLFRKVGRDHFLAIP